MRRPREAIHAAGIDTCRRQQLQGIKALEVRCREAQTTAETLARDHYATTGVRATKELPSLLHRTLGDGAADGGRTDRPLIAVEQRHITQQRDAALRGKRFVLLGAQLTPVRAEAMIIAKEKVRHPVVRR